MHSLHCRLILCFCDVGSFFYIVQVVEVCVHFLLYLRLYSYNRVVHVLTCDVLWGNFFGGFWDLGLLLCFGLRLLLWLLRGLWIGIILVLLHFSLGQLLWIFKKCFFRVVIRAECRNILIIGNILCFILLILIVFIIEEWLIVGFYFFVQF